MTMPAQAAPTGDASSVNPPVDPASVDITVNSADGSGTGGDTAAIAVGAALATSAEASDTAENAEQTAQVAADIAIGASEAAASAEATAWDAQTQLTELAAQQAQLGQAFVIMADTLDTHTRALESLLAGQQAPAALPPAVVDAGPAEPDSEPKPRHWLERKIGRKRK